jgi:hypothetical protein
MMQNEIVLQYPVGQEACPWGVRSLGAYFAVHNSQTKEEVRVGLIAHAGVFARALEEAARRNSDVPAVASVPAEPVKDAPLPLFSLKRLLTPDTKDGLYIAGELVRWGGIVLSMFY